MQGCREPYVGGKERVNIAFSSCFLAVVVGEVKSILRCDPVQAKRTRGINPQSFA
jgi:hypothetical protein